MENLVIESLINNTSTFKDKELFDILKEEHNKLIRKYQIFLEETNIPTIYDLHSDEFRPVVQEDINQLLVINQYYGRMVELFSDTLSYVSGPDYGRIPKKGIRNLSKKLLELHKQCREEIKSKNN